VSPLATMLVAVATACALAGVAQATRSRLVGATPRSDDSEAGASTPRRFRLHARRRWRAAKRHRAAADAEIPQLLDLLAAASSAGLAAPLALRRAADGLTGPLADEVGATVRAVDLGARWRDELDALAERLDLPDLRRTVSALTRTETLGASLAQATAELAASVRQARRAATMERARTAPVKMLFPLVFLVLPAFLLLTVVPVLLTTVRSIG
jgi:tight adherence protein C